MRLEDLRIATNAALGLVNPSIEELMFGVLGQLRAAARADGAYILVRPGSDEPSQWVVADGLNASQGVLYGYLYAGHQPTVDGGLLGEALRNSQWLPQTHEGAFEILRLEDPALPSLVAGAMGQAQVHTIASLTLTLAHVGTGALALFYCGLPRSAPALAPLAESAADAVRYVLLRDAYLDKEARLRMYRALASTSRCAMYQTDPKGRIAKVNQAWLDLVQRTPQEVIGRHITDFLEPEAQPVVRQWHQDTELNQERVGAFTLVLPDGSRTPVTVVCRRVHFKQGTSVWVATIHPLPRVPQRRLPGRYARLLTAREQEVVTHLLSGHRVRSAAKALYLSEHTVRNHLKRVFRKLGVSSQAELLELATTEPDPGA